MNEAPSPSEPWNTVISARSKRQALDWSLVLASQGIEATLQMADSDEAKSWHLVVRPVDHARAVQAIWQFHDENRPPRWRQALPWTGLIFDWRAIGWFVLIIIFFVLQNHFQPTLENSGIMDNRAVQHGQWWRLFTAVNLHRDLAHLAANVTTGILLLGLAMGSFGAGWTVLCAYLAGVGGNLAGFILYTKPYHGLGASGMVMGALGLLAVDSLLAWRHHANHTLLAIRGFMGSILLLVLLGFNPDSDVVAHVGGFVCGAMLGLILFLVPRSLLHHSLMNHGAELLCAALMILSWGLALR